MYLDYRRRLWDGEKAEAPDFFAWERRWVDENCAAAAGRAP
jgi:hypothetical protein